MQRQFDVNCVLAVLVRYASDGNGIEQVRIGVVNLKVEVRFALMSTPIFLMRRNPLRTSAARIRTPA